MDNSKPTTIVIFGASGDLTRRKLIPALFNSFAKGRLPENFHIVGYARRPWDHAQFKSLLLEGLKEFAAGHYDAEKWDKMCARTYYVQGDLDNVDDFTKLDDYLNQIEDGPANRLYYLAIAPRFFVPVVAHLGSANMVSETDGWRRIVVEKPFGHDLASAKALNEEIHAVFQEHQIYRIDHYLGKETAQNILYFRFANT
ncbi:MAG: glucose-6-phosphate dehydrogenase, partial [Anaerolineales bacterium]|nr:glucose-6-phosphate dehydrogenase [Anaerolineales bacterium]